MSLTKPALNKLGKNKKVQKIQKKVVKGGRSFRSLNQRSHEKYIPVKGQMQIIQCKSCYYYSAAPRIYHTRVNSLNKCPECTSENLEYYSASSSRLFEYILTNIN